MKKIFLVLLLMIFTVSMTSCKKEDKIDYIDPVVDDNNYPSNTDVNENAGNENPNSENTNINTDSNYAEPNDDITVSTTPSASTAVEETVAKVYDAVVSISASSATQSSSGSGVLFLEDNNLGLSYIVTCFHVIENCPYLNVTLLNGETYEAKLVAGYDDEDLAVLSIEKTDLTYVDFYSDSNSLKLGSQVVCIGNPLGTLPGSVSSGYLSYINRKIQIDSYNYMELLQTDVAINSGNSGGGLFNTSGALIGIVNAKYASEAIEGLGFAIPINTVKDVVLKFLSTAKYDKNNKSWDEGYYAGDWELGFSISDGYYRPNGFFGTSEHVIYISGLSQNSTSSGENMFEYEDIITEVKIDYGSLDKEDKSLTLTTASTLLNDIYTSNLQIGDSIIFTIKRDDATTTINVNLEQFIYSI